MKKIRLLLPFTHGLDMDALEDAVLLAKGCGAILVPVALVSNLRQPARGPRLEALQQSKDFLEAARCKAERYGVSTERLEVFTNNAVLSAATLAREMACEGILLFVREGSSVFLHPVEVRELTEQTTCQLYVAHLQPKELPLGVQKVFATFSQWVRARRGMREALPMSPTQNAAEGEVASAVH